MTGIIIGLYGLYQLWARCRAALWRLFPGHQRLLNVARPVGAPAPDFLPRARPRRGGQPKPLWVRKWVLRRFEQGVCSPYVIALEFQRVHAAGGITLCKSTVYNWLVKHRARAKRVRAYTRNRWPEPTPANARWCVDCTGKADASGAVNHIAGILDEGSRSALDLSRIGRISTCTLLHHLFAAIDRYGKPLAIITDNASVFKGVLFRTVLAVAGIRHDFIEPGCPWQNRIERFFGTLKDKLNHVTPTSPQALDRLLAQFAFWYNECRPHQHLHGYTPAEVWRGVHPFDTPPKEVICFEAWEGRLKGFYMRR